MKKRAVGQLALGLSLIIGIWAIIASGGGGGGGGGDGMEYTGKESHATITSANAKDLAGKAYIGGNTGTAMGSLNASARQTAGDFPQHSNLRFLQVMDDAVQSIGVGYFSRSIGPAATESGEMSGSCGGKASYRIEVNEANGAFTGDMSFSSYCDAGVKINGQVSFSGLYDMNADEILMFDFTFEALKVTSGSESVVMRGNLSIDASGSTQTATMDFCMRDDSGKVFWINDYQMSMVENGYSVTIDLTGRFYHPDHGYIDLMTTQSLKVYAYDEYPHAGTLVLQGSGGTEAVLTAIDSTYCELKADLDGDGSHEWRTGAVTWDELIEGSGQGGLPSAGQWSGSAGFGEIGFVVSADQAGIEETTLKFDKFSCGGVTYSGTFTTGRTPGWPIMNNTVEVDLDLDSSNPGDEKMLLEGTFDSNGTSASGTYEANFNGSRCNGTWQARPGVVIDTLNWIDGKQTLITYQYSGGRLSGLNFYRKFEATADASDLMITATLKEDSSSGRTIDNQSGSFPVAENTTYTIKVHVNVIGQGRCSPSDKDVMVFSSPAASSTRVTHIYPTVEYSNFYCISGYNIDSIILE